MRILSLLGSPRANGTTHSMARLIAGGLSGGGPVEEIALQEKHIRPCRGCQSCDAAPHVCPLARTDDAEAVFAAIAAADVVLWTSPVYFYGLPAQAKALVDRSQRIWAGVEAGRPAGKGPLVLAALATARPRGEQLFTGGFGRGILAAVGVVLGFFGGGRFGSLGFRTFFLGGDVDEGTAGDEQGDFGAGRGRDSQGDGQGQHTAQQGGTWQ